MKISPIPAQIWRHQALGLTLLLVVASTLSSCSAPAKSVNDQAKVDPQLEKQVLEIIRKNPQAIIESVQAYQEQQQENLKAEREKFITTMKTDPSKSIGDSPWMGSPDKKIVLLEFSDFQCPFCSRAHKTTKEFMAKYKDKVTLAYKHLPLTEIHTEALPAARASWAAHQQGKFWEYHDALFEQQDKLGEDLYISIAKKLGLDLDKFNKDRASDAALKAIEKDTEIASNLGITGTPFFLMNGESFSGAVDITEMEKILARVSGATK